MATPNTQSSIKKTLAIGVGTLVTLSLPSQVMAHHIINTTLQTRITSSTGLGDNDPTTVAAQIVSAFLGLLAIIALVLIIYAGFRWMTAGGNEEKVTEARKTLQAAVIGLLIILASYGIALFVFTIIERATGQGTV